MKSDFFADNDKLEIALRTATLLNFNDAWIESSRMPMFIAQVDYQEMLNYRAMNESEAIDSYLAEEARKLN